MAAAAAVVGANPSLSRNPNSRSLPAAASYRAPSPTSLYLPSSTPRGGLAGPAVALGGAGLVLATVASACVFPSLAAAADLLPLQLQEPANALSLPTWAIHVSSVVEWVTAMALVWEYGDKSGFETWKGLSWGMVPLLGGAFCACTWHFFYNSESLEHSAHPRSCYSSRQHMHSSGSSPCSNMEILVALQAALTVIGNLTMCIAAFRIYRSSQRGSEKS